MTSQFIVDDFTGGLNLRADVFNLARNESPNLLNVDIDPRGGVQSRSGTVQVNSADIGSIAAGSFSPNRMFHWRKGSQQLMLAANNKVFYATNDNFTDTTIATTNDYGAEFAEWIGYQPLLYVACGAGSQSHKWNGSTKTALTVSGAGAWQDDLLSPIGTHMPKAEHVAAHVDRLWVANIEEGTTAYPDRVRWSHPLFPESWREQDYVDVVGGGEGVTAIVPFAEHILVFKPRAVFAIYGYNEQTFQVVPVTQELGAFSSQCVTGSEQAVFFFSWPDGLFMYDGSSIKDLFVPLRPLVTTGELNKNALNTVHVNWASRRVFLSLPVGITPDFFENYDDTSGDGVVYDDIDLKYDGFTRPAAPTATFVWDGTLGKGGAWLRHRTADGYAMVAATDYVLPTTGFTTAVFAHPYYPQVNRFDFDLYTDEIDGVATNFDSIYIMSWLDAKQPQRRKFWRSPEFVLNHSHDGYTIDVDVFRDWSTFKYERTFEVGIEDHEHSNPDDIDSWVSNYGSDTVRGAVSLGSCRSVQLRFRGRGGHEWGVNAVIFRYTNRSVRT